MRLCVWEDSWITPRNALPAKGAGGLGRACRKEQAKRHMEPPAGIGWCLQRKASSGEGCADGSVARRRGCDVCKGGRRCQALCRCPFSDQPQTGRGGDDLARLGNLLKVMQAGKGSFCVFAPTDPSFQVTVRAEVRTHSVSCRVMAVAQLHHHHWFFLALGRARALYPSLEINKFLKMWV